MLSHIPHIPHLQARIEANCIPEPNSGCWIWLASCYRDGYGRIRAAPVQGQQRAHRISWAAFKGAVPEGAHVLHHCDNPSCVNPDHLWLGTHKDNMRDREIKDRNRGGKRIRPNTIGTTYIAKSNRWQAQFSGRYLGYFKTKEEASAAYLTARNGEKS